MALSREFAANVEKHYLALYRRMLQRETADLRVFVINRAANFVLGKEGVYWVTPGPYSPVGPEESMPSEIRKKDCATVSPSCTRYSRERVSNSCFVWRTSRTHCDSLPAGVFSILGEPGGETV